MYMRLLGYPADKITMLTTYNGQKHLLRDVVAQRCGDNPLIGGWIVGLLLSGLAFVCTALCTLILSLGVR